jgi:hypothetical protein
VRASPDWLTSAASAFCVCRLPRTHRPDGPPLLFSLSIYILDSESVLLVCHGFCLCHRLFVCFCCLCQNRCFSVTMFLSLSLYVRTMRVCMWSYFPAEGEAAVREACVREAGAARLDTVPQVLAEGIRTTLYPSLSIRFIHIRASCFICVSHIWDDRMAFACLSLIVPRRASMQRRSCSCERGSLPASPIRSSSRRVRVHRS